MRVRYVSTQDHIKELEEQLKIEIGYLKVLQQDPNFLVQTQNECKRKIAELRKLILEEKSKFKIKEMAV